MSWEELFIPLLGLVLIAAFGIALKMQNKRNASRAVGLPRLSVQEELQRLNEMKEKGLIDEEELSILKKNLVGSVQIGRS